MSDIKLTASSREDIGKGASRRLRRNEHIPAILYGAGKQPQAIVLEHKQVIKALENEEFYSQILTLELNDKNERVVLKDMQRHPYKPKVTHMDFLRIKAGERITMHIPLRFINEAAAPGVLQRGLVSHLMSEVEVRCLPENLPTHIEVDLSNLQLDESIHLSEIMLPKGVEILAISRDEEYDQPVVAIHAAKAAPEEPTEEVTAPTAVAAGAKPAKEPEVEN